MLSVTPMLYKVHLALPMLGALSEDCEVNVLWRKLPVSGFRPMLKTLTEFVHSTQSTEQLSLVSAYVEIGFSSGACTPKGGISHHHNNVEWSCHARIGSLR